MTTKDHCLFLKDKQNLVVNDNLNDKFKNLNLNQSNQCFADTIQSKKVENDNKAISNYDDFSHKYDLQTRQKRTSFGKTKLGTSFANPNIQNNYGKKEEEESKEGKTLNANSSTLSLHITAYENSIDAATSGDPINGDPINGEKDKTNKKKENISSIKNWKSVKGSIKDSSSVVKYAFELPRQQQDQNNDPEVMQFKASQRLSNVNGTPSSSNAEHANNMDQNVTADDDLQIHTPPVQQQLQSQIRHGSEQLKIRPIMKQRHIRLAINFGPPQMHFNSDDGDEGNEKPICQECGAAFVSLDNLTAHFERCSIRKKKLLNERSIYMSGFTSKIDVASVKEVLGQFGKVEKVIVDKEWDRYAIVSFENSEQAAAAIKASELKIGNDTITIKQARMKTDEYNFQSPEIHVDDVVSELQKAENETTILEQMELMLNAFGICNETRSLRLKLCRFLEKQFANYFNAEIRCRLFGSSISGLGTKYADVDINFIVCPLPGISTAVHPLHRRELGNVPLAILKTEKLTYEEYNDLPKEVRQDLVYRILYDIHTRLGAISHVRSISKSKCPVVRFLYNGELQCELSIGNMFSEKKAQFLTDITNSQSDILHKVLFTLRLWAQTHGIFGTNSSNKPAAFKSYAFSLLFVAFLQDSNLIGPITFRGNEFIDDWVTDYIHPILEVNSSNETLVSVIRGFFVYICHKIKENSVVSIRDAKIYDWEEFWVNAATIDTRITKKFEKSFINVQDPLELSHNVCAAVGRPVIALLRRKAMLSLSKLKTSSFSLSSIFDLSATQNGNGDANNHGSTDMELQLTLIPELSPSKVLEAVNIVFEDILKLDLIPEQTNKRQKIESKALQGFSSYFSTCETWIGRRPIKREIQKKHKDLDIKDVEQMVSSTIQRNSLGWDGKSNDPLLEFCVESLYDPDTGKLSLQFRRNMGDTKKVNDIFHFFQQFFEKDNCQILRNVLSLPSAGPMDSVLSSPSPNAMEID